ncbi:MAG: lipase family protein [Archangium sp.]
MLGVLALVGCGPPGVSADAGSDSDASVSTGGGGGGATGGGGSATGGGGSATGGGGTTGGGSATGGGGAATGGGTTDDAGTDAGIVDAGTPSVSDPAAACSDAQGEIYTVSASGNEPLGARLKCHFDRTLTAMQVMMETPSAPSNPSPVDLHLLAYRTNRRGPAGNLPGVGTARVYLPRNAKSGPLPVVVVMHGSVGVADNCAPSTEMNGLFSLALPWASRGYAVIAPDLAGLGNAGVQGYVDNHDTAMSVLDGIRALRSLLPGGALDGRAILIGYSQGGGAVLAAQTLERSYGSGGQITAVVGVAPQFFTRLNSFGYVGMLRNPTALTVAQGYTKPVVGALRHYAWFENTLGPGHGLDAFPADGGQGTVDALERRCLIDLGAWLPSNRTRVGELIDENLRTTFLACVDGPTSAGCVPPGKPFYDGLVSDVMAGDSLGSPVLYLQGGLDTVMPVGEEAACNVPAMRDAGVRLTYCTDNFAAHNNIYDRNVELVRTWAESTAYGIPAPACSNAGLLACPP